MNTPTLYGYLLPLFVSRTGAFARPPGELELNHGSAPPVAQLGGRWIIAAGDSEAGMVQAEGYDLVGWLPGGARELRCPDEDAPCSFSTLAVVDFSILVGLGEDFLRSYRFLDNSGVLTTGYSDASLPEGINEWSEVAGGAVAEAPDGSVCIVGATRADPPTTAVLRIVPGDEDSPEVSLEVVHLETARAGAAATWVEDHGLVVVGGSSEGAGAELLAEGATAFAALPFPADPSAGGANAALDGDTVVRIGGRDLTDQPVPTASYSLTCEADCLPEPLGGTAELRATSAYALDDGSVLAIGLGTDDVTSAVLLSEGEEQAVALREPRRRASSLRVSTGHIAVVGGLDSDGGFVSTVELFAP
jgi:hypothetical protein